MRRKKLPCPVVSVGNISIGGTGKTSFVLRLLAFFERTRRNPAVLKRGEGSDQGIVWPNTDLETAEIAKKYGDEVALLNYRNPKIPIGVSKDRIKMGKRILSQADTDILLLDDGFQYSCLERDIDLVLLADRRETQKWQLPAGPLRDNPRTLGKADFVSVGMTDSDQEGTQGNSPHENFYPQAVLLQHHYEFEGLYHQGKDVTGEFRNNQFDLVTTLARPSKVEQMLVEEGLSEFRHHAHPDHSILDWEDIESNVGSDRILVTEKEFVKFPPEKRRLLTVLRSRFVIEGFSNLAHEIRNLPKHNSGS